MKIKYKNLTEEQKEFIAQTYLTSISHNEKIEILTIRFGVTGRTIRNWWTKLGINTINSNRPRQISKAMQREISEDSRVLLVTTAQNKTLVNTPMLTNMESYRDYLIKEKGINCEIVVIPSTYHNPTKIIEDPRASNWWATEVDKYIHYNKIIFGDCLIHTSFRVRPTASLPLSGLDLLAGGRHLVIGHPRVHFKTLPRFKEDPLYTMSTTGYCTYKNYSDSKAGDIGENHHTYGFSIIEMDEDGICLVPRNVKCNQDGEFTDIVYNVKGGKVTTIDSSEGFIWGDIHHQELDTECYAYTIDLINNLKPKVNILHDVLDGGSKGLNPHETKDMYILKKKIREGKDNVVKEVSEAVDFVNKVQLDTDSDVKVIYSNHDFFLDRYINDHNWKKDLYNSEGYLQYAYLQQTEDMEKHGCIFGYLVNTYGNRRIEYLSPKDKFMVGDYVVSLHGDFGQNGAKGTINTWKRLNEKTITAHSHSPQMVDGSTIVGVSAKLDQYYVRRGLSSWAHSHSVVHSSGKNQLLVMNNDYKITNLI